MGDNRPPVYKETDETGNEILIIRASAIGHPCLWELIAAGQGEEPLPTPNVLQRAFDEGNALEPVIIKRLERDYGVVFESHQSEGELWLGDSVAIRFHSDGIGEYTQEQTDMFVNPYTYRCVVEVKALSDALYQIAARGSIGDVIDEYPWQLSTMMHGEQLPGLWVAYNKGLPPDEDGNRPPCADAGKMILELVPTPPVSLTELQLKASLIKEGVYGESVFTSDRPCGSPDHWPCRYLHIRPQPEGQSDQREVLIPENPEEVDRLVIEYLSYKGQADEAEAGYKRARDQLTQLAGDAGFIQTDKFWVPIHGGRGSGKIAWDEMSPELKAAVEKYKRPGSKYKYLMGKTIKRLGF